MWVSWVWKMEQTEDILVSKSLQCMHCCELVTVALIFSLFFTSNANCC